MGGSFDPPHEGHREISVRALMRLRLDCFWWMVTPGNPLKDNAALPPLEDRMRRAASIAAHPRIVISGAEQVFATRHTAALVTRLRRRRPSVRYVWIMGSDNLAEFHLWESWRKIAQSLPIAVISRPGALAAPLSARAAQALRDARVDENDAPTLARRRPPAWAYIGTPRSHASSTALRQAQGTS